MTASSSCPVSAPVSPFAILDALTVRRLLAITREMLAAAETEDWEAVSRGDIERRSLLDAAADHARADEASAALIETLRETDLALLRRARRSRDALVERAHQVRAERGAHHSYASVMAGTDRAGEQA